MATTLNDTGYWLVGLDGGVFAFGDARFNGAANDRGGNALSIVNDGQDGYNIIMDDGASLHFVKPSGQ
jgi:hypothetical protein